jgi:hypothetical protein
MKKTLIAVVLFSLSVGCGDKKGDEKKGGGPDQPPAAESKAPPPKQVKLVATDLSPAGIEATMQAPEGATVKEAFGSAEVATADNSFHLEIGTDKADMAARKAEIDGNDINKLKRYVIDEPDGILYESVVMGKSEFHLLVNAEGGESGFECQDSKGPSYTEAQAQAMFKACKTLAPK